MVKSKQYEHVKFILKNDVLYCIYEPGVVTLEVAKDVVKCRQEFTKGEQLKNLVQSQEMPKMTKEARDFLSSDEGTKNIIAGALLINSSFQATLANFFLKVTRPKIPAKFSLQKKKH